MTVAHNYEKELNHTLTEFKRLAFDHKDWALKKEESNIKIYSTKLPSSKWECFKGETTVHMPVERILDIVHPTETYRQQFDPNFSSATILEILDENTGTGIVKQFFKKALLGLLSPRDSIDIFQFYKTDDYQYSCFSSVNYPNIPVDPDCVRALSFPMGILAMPTSDPDTSRVIAISHVDFNLPAILPQPMVEAVIPSNFVSYFTALKKMEFQPYTPLGSEAPLCKWRKK